LNAKKEDARPRDEAANKYHCPITPRLAEGEDQQRRHARQSDDQEGQQQDQCNGYPLNGCQVAGTRNWGQRVTPFVCRSARRLLDFVAETVLRHVAHVASQLATGALGDE